MTLLFKGSYATKPSQKSVRNITAVYLKILLQNWFWVYSTVVSGWCGNGALKKFDFDKGPSYHFWCTFLHKVERFLKFIYQTQTDLTRHATKVCFMKTKFRYATFHFRRIAVGSTGCVLKFCYHEAYFSRFSF